MKEIGKELVVPKKTEEFYSESADGTLVLQPILSIEEAKNRGIIHVVEADQRIYILAYDTLKIDGTPRGISLPYIQRETQVIKSKQAGTKAIPDLCIDLPPTRASIVNQEIRLPIAFLDTAKALSKFSILRRTPVLQALALFDQTERVNIWSVTKDSVAHQFKYAVQIGDEPITDAIARESTTQTEQTNSHVWGPNVDEFLYLEQIYEGNGFDILKVRSEDYPDHELPMMLFYDYESSSAIEILIPRIALERGWDILAYDSGSTSENKFDVLSFVRQMERRHMTHMTSETSVFPAIHILDIASHTGWADDLRDAGIDLREYTQWVSFDVYNFNIGNILVKYRGPQEDD